MKSKLKKRASIIIVLGIFFAISSIYYSNPYLKATSKDKSTDYSGDITLDRENLKISILSGKIHIDNNWTAAKAAGICTGSGSYSDPYVIQNLEIDGEGSGSCILIENSDVYFKIEDCTLYNSEDHPNAGILLNNTDNGFLIYNNISNNNGYGIYVYSSSNNEISGNNANNNGGGISLSYSDNNTILGNICENNWNGVTLGHSNNNLISENTVNNNDNVGIGYYISYNNIISGNIIYYNNKWGISLWSSQHNNITGNIVNHSGDLGIYVHLSLLNNIYLNCFINNTINAYDDRLNNWDNGIKGNYWSDYTGSDADGDGIGDVAYNITGPAGDQKDNFPLMKCPISAQDGGGIPFELIILISVISGVAVIGVATLLLVRRKRKRIE